MLIRYSKADGKMENMTFCQTNYGMACNLEYFHGGLDSSDSDRTRDGKSFGETDSAGKVI